MPPRTPRLLVLGAVLGACLAAPASAIGEPWEQIRTGFIDPLNSMLHSHFPTQLQERNLDVLTRLYATKTGTGLLFGGGVPSETEASETMLRWVDERGDEPIRERYQHLLDLFGEIERAELRIGRIDWRNPDPMGYRATVHLLVRGKSPKGELRQLEQHAILRVRFFDPFWEITAEEITARTLVTLASPRFESIAAAAGVEHLHANELSPPFLLFGNLRETPVRQASGVAVGDYDGDGCEDLLLAGSPELLLLRSGCDGTFLQTTGTAGLPVDYPAAASGVVFFDYDNDGRQDLYVAAVWGGDRLYHNEGDGRFTDVSAAAGIPPGRWGSMPAIADFDLDGYLDIYIARMGDHEKRVPRPPDNARNGVRGTLLHNLGDGRFEDVSAKAGVDSPGWDMAAAWGDYDGDGWPDLYVANEFGDNRLYHNDRNGSFSDRTDAAGVADGGAGMGVAWGDTDGDGDLDLYVAGMHANSGWALFHPEFPLPIPWYFRFIGLFTDAVQIEADTITDRLSRGSALLRNNGDGTFTDISDRAGVRDAQWSFGVAFFDYDNDGDLDLYGVNGFITGPIKEDV